MCGAAQLLQKTVHNGRYVPVFRIFSLCRTDKLRRQQRRVYRLYVTA